MNREFVGVYNWLKTNRLSLNVNKTSYVKISNQKNASDIKHRDSILTKGSTVKFLVVILYKNLTLKNITTEVSKSVLMKRPHCQPGDVIDKLYSSLVFSNVACAFLALRRSGRTDAAKIECAHRRACKLLTDCNKKILTFHSIYDYFALLEPFNTNTLNFHQYFKDKLSFYQASHMHNTMQTQNK